MDAYRIEMREDGFWLLVDTEWGESTHMLKVGDPEALYDAVRREIGPWLHERDEAARTRPEARDVYACDPDESGGILVGIREDGSKHWEEDSDRKYDLAKEDGYDFSDPKHPRYHSTHVDIWDARDDR